MYPNEQHGQILEEILRNTPKEESPLDISVMSHSVAMVLFQQEILERRISDEFEQEILFSRLFGLGAKIICIILDSVKTPEYTENMTNTRRKFAGIHMSTELMARFQHGVIDFASRFKSRNLEDFVEFNFAEFLSEYAPSSGRTITP